jgi:hypothetical protein
MNKRLHKIGSEKITHFDKNFDQIYDLYKKKSIDSGYTGDLKFIKERGRVLIYVELIPPSI